MAENISINVDVKAVEDSASFKAVSNAFRKALSDGVSVSDIFKPMRVEADTVAKAIAGDFSNSSRQMYDNMASGFLKIREIMRQSSANGLFNIQDVRAFDSVVNNLAMSYSRLASGAVTNENAIDSIFRRIEVLSRQYERLGVAASNIIPQSVMRDITTVDAAMEDLHRSVEAFNESLEQEIDNAQGRAILARIGEEREQLRELTNAWRDYYDARDSSRARGVQQSDLQSAFQQFYDNQSNANLASRAQSIRGALSALEGLGSIGAGFGSALVGGLNTVYSAAKKVFPYIQKAAQAAFSVARKELEIMGKSAQVAFAGLTKIAKISLKPLVGDLFSARQSADALSSAFSSLQRMALGLVSIAAIKRAATSMLSLSSSVIEVQNVVDTTFGDMAYVIDDFAASAQRSFGLSELAAKNYASSIGGIVKSAGLGSDATLKMSLGITKLTADVASFYNISQDEAFRKLQSGLTGQTAAMRSLGVSLTKANLEAYRLSQGIDTAYSSMSEAEKMALRYNYMLQSLSDAQGDFSKTSGSWANQTRLLTLQIEQLGAILGGFLQKILYPMLTVVNQILASAITGASALARMFGFDMTSLQKQQGVYGASAGVAIDETAASSMEDLADSTEDAAAAQSKLNKEQKKGLANIHQLNVLQDNSSSGTSSGGSGAGGIGDFGGISFDLLDYAKVEEQENPIDKLFEGIRRAVEDNDWYGVGSLLAEALNSIFDDLDLTKYTDAVTKWATNFAEVLNGFVQNIHLGEIGRVLGEGFNLIIAAWNSFFDAFDFVEAGAKLAEGFNGLIAAIDFYEAGKAIVQQFNAFYQTLLGFAANTDWTLVGTKIADFLNGAIENIDLSSFKQALANLGLGLATAINETIDGVNWDGFGARIAEFFNGIIFGLTVFFVELDWGAVGEALATSINGFFTNFNLETLLTGIDSFFSGMLELLAGAANTLDFERISEVVTGVVSSITSGFADIMQSDSFLYLVGEITALLLDALASIDWEGLALGTFKIAETIVSTLWDWLQTEFANVQWSDLARQLGQFLTGVVQDIDWIGLGDELGRLTQDLVDALFVFIENFDWLTLIAGVLYVLGSVLWGLVKSLFTGLMKLLNTLIEGIFEALGVFDWLGLLGELIGLVFALLYKVIKGLFIDLPSWIWEQITGAFDALAKMDWVKGLTGMIDKLWEGLKSLLGGVIDKGKKMLTDFINDPIGSLGSAAQSAWEGLKNTFSKQSVPVTMSLQGGAGSIGVVSQLPHLAQGAVIPPNNEFMAVLGDQRRGVNIETPLATMISAFEQALTSMAPMLGGIQQVTIPVYVNNELTTTQVVRLQDMARYRSGGL